MVPSVRGVRINSLTIATCQNTCTWRDDSRFSQLVRVLHHAFVSNPPCELPSGGYLYLALVQASHRIIRPFSCLRSLVYSRRPRTRCPLEVAFVIRTTAAGWEMTWSYDAVKLIIVRYLYLDVASNLWCRLNGMSQLEAPWDASGKTKIEDSRLHPSERRRCHEIDIRVSRGSAGRGILVRVNINDNNDVTDFDAPRSTRKIS
ncbi:hypothetical protein A0H81_02140 [Grifola frondosa]|uniref:Uncharacterized protein n=1 Tax=Grifola frondosa TaxID=5627 RepID=A0A1C7MPS7_GRIFR|nr:hypothetical protein A0H81_02140 [Grifola frondosa]